MNLIFVGAVIAVIMSYTTKSQSCEPGMCFNWRISRTMLSLFCKVDDFHFKTFIEDPKGKVQAECLPPISTIHCHTKYNNVTITLDTNTNELIFTLRGIINKQVNGNWTCRHGLRSNVAHVEVTVFTHEDVQEKEEHKLTLFGIRCIDIVICISALSFLAATIITLVIMSFLPRTPFIFDDFLNRKVRKVRNILGHQDNSHQNTKAVSSLKKCLFAVIAVLYFGIVVVIGKIDSIKCSSKWFFVGFSLVIGCISSLLFLSKDRDISSENVTTNASNLGVEEGPSLLGVQNESPI